MSSESAFSAKEKVTPEQVIERCAHYGFHITKPGFAEYLADMFNEPITWGPGPMVFGSWDMSDAIKEANRAAARKMMEEAQGLQLRHCCCHDPRCPTSGPPYSQGNRTASGLRMMLDEWRYKF